MLMITLETYNKMNIHSHYFSPPKKSRGSNNFGDMLVPIILKWMFNKGTTHVSCKTNTKLLCIGSELASGKHLQQNDVVWGYGAKYDRPINVPSGVKFCSVRGKLTRALIKNYDVPEVFGDPAILMPLIYTPKVTDKFEIGVIPHYVDKPLFKLNKYKFIDIQANPYKVMDAINSCAVIVATSLHGAIVAESYGIPVVWLQVSDKIGGADFKWNDYFSGTGRKPQKAVRLKPPITDKAIKQIISKVLPPQVADRDKLIQAGKDNEQYILRTCK